MKPSSYPLEYSAFIFSLMLALASLTPSSYLTGAVKKIETRAAAMVASV
jgi:hypothetical protein